MSLYSNFRETCEEVSERYALASSRVNELSQGQICHDFPDGFAEYFQKTACLIRDIINYAETSEPNRAETLAEPFYEELLEENYAWSFANPDYAVTRLGKEAGVSFSCLYSEVRASIGYAKNGNLKAVTLCMELFLEVYCMTECLAGEGSFSSHAAAKSLQESLYYYVLDYSEYFVELAIRERMEEENQTEADCKQDNASVIVSALGFEKKSLLESPFKHYYIDHANDLGIIFDHTIRDRILARIENLCHEAPEIFSKPFTFQEFQGESFRKCEPRKLSYFSHKQKVMLEEIRAKLNSIIS